MNPRLQAGVAWLTKFADEALGIDGERLFDKIDWHFARIGKVDRRASKRRWYQMVPLG